VSDPVPEKIGKYPVVREIGLGATSRVYLAEDQFNSQQVAIKLVQRDLAASNETRRQIQSAFLNESALAGKLQHPHIAAIYDAVSESEQSYIVMEYVSGGTLERHCSFEALLSIERVIEFVFMACLALDYAQKQGVIHCDIKPANLLLTPEGKLKISDFGAAQYSEASHTYFTGVGSPLYMSPEQVSDKRLNHQTDIYSLGAVMYQLLTGKPPFTGSSHESLLYQIMSIEPPKPRLHRPDLPPEVERIALRALAKSREERYPDWRDFASDLEKLFENLNLPDQDTSEAERFSVLRQLPLFQGFGDVEIWETLRIGHWRKEPVDTKVIQEGKVCGGFFIIVAGKVEVSRAGEPLDKLGEGQFFGDVLYFEGAGTPRSTSVTTTKRSVLLEIKGESLRRASAACQVQFNHALLRMLVRRVERVPQAVEKKPAA
jgi:serine/threonine protein kinase